MLLVVILRYSDEFGGLEANYMIEDRQVLSATKI